MHGVRQDAIGLSVRNAQVQQRIFLQSSLPQSGKTSILGSTSSWQNKCGGRTVGSGGVIYLHCVLCRRPFRRYRCWVLRRGGCAYFCSRRCWKLARRLQTQYLIDGRLEALLRGEFAQIKAAHRARVKASQAEYERTARRIGG
jgi:hypothetical protein